MPSVVITGSNRGIGLELVKHFSEQGWKVYAAIRELSKTPTVEGDIEWVKIDSDSLTDAGEVAKSIKDKGETVDVVIANAGINGAVEPFASIDPTSIDQAFATNVRAVVVLFQAFKDALEESKGKFITISSGVGTITQDMYPGMGVYGATKAALNYVTRKLHFENPNLLVAALVPGWVATDMGNAGAKLYGLEAPPDDIKVTLPAMIKLIQEGDEEKLGGWTTSWNGDRLDF